MLPPPSSSPTPALGLLPPPPTAAASPAGWGTSTSHSPAAPTHFLPPQPSPSPPSSEDAPVDHNFDTHEPNFHAGEGATPLLAAPPSALLTPAVTVASSSTP